MQTSKSFTGKEIGAMAVSVGAALAAILSLVYHLDQPMSAAELASIPEGSCLHGKIASFLATPQRAPSFPMRESSVLTRMVSKSFTAECDLQARQRQQDAEASALRLTQLEALRSAASVPLPGL